jgi:hypothetical protein
MVALYACWSNFVKMLKGDYSGCDRLPASRRFLAPPDRRHGDAALACLCVVPPRRPMAPPGINPRHYRRAKT